MYIEDIAARIEEMIQAKIIIADIEKISYDEENILSQITQRYVEKYHKHKRNFQDTSLFQHCSALKKFLMCKAVALPQEPEL